MRFSNDPFLVLKDSDGFSNDLIEIKTGAERKKTEKKLRIDLESWVEVHSSKFRKKEIDLTIVAYINKNRMKKQDVDNITKVVMDSIQRPHRESGLFDEFSKRPYLLENDSQVRRLLVYKIEKTEVETKNDRKVDTDSIIISFREHDPDKEMILVTKNSFP